MPAIIINSWMPESLDEVREQQSKQKQNKQQQKQQQQSEQHLQHCQQLPSHHYNRSQHHQHNQHQRKYRVHQRYQYHLYQYQRHQHNICKHKAAAAATASVAAKKTSQHRNFYNLNTKSETSESNNIIHTITKITIPSTIPLSALLALSRTSTTTATPPASPTSILTQTRPAIPSLKSTLLQIPTPRLTLTSAAAAASSSLTPPRPFTTSIRCKISTRRRLCAAIFTLILSIICHYSNAQQTSEAAATMMMPHQQQQHQQLSRNSQQMLEGKPQLNSNSTNNFSSFTHNKTAHNTVDNNFSPWQGNITRRINFSPTTALETDSQSIDRNHHTTTTTTDHFESLSIVDLERNKDEYNKHIQPSSIELGPIFDFGLPRNITGRTGQSEAIIKCRVDMLHDKSVSWIRKRDLHILTVGTTTYTTDKRFEVSTTKDERDWILHIKSPQVRDSGIYECQVNTEPKISMAFQLNIIEIPADAKAIIIGPPDLHFKVGSAIVLQCLVTQPTVKDIGPIYWYRGEQMITPFQQQQDDNNNNNGNGLDNDHNDDDDDDDMGVADSALLLPSTPAVDNVNSFAVNTRTMDDLTNDIMEDFTARIAMESQLGDTLKSRLRISNAQTTDTGNYTCQPTTANSASVMVHVINDEKPAAMQKSCAQALTVPATAVSARVFLCCLSAALLACRHINTQKLKNIMWSHMKELLVLFMQLVPTPPTPLHHFPMLMRVLLLPTLLPWMVLIADCCCCSFFLLFLMATGIVITSMVGCRLVVAPTLSPLKLVTVLWLVLTMLLMLMLLLLLLLLMPLSS